MENKLLIEQIEKIIEVFTSIIENNINILEKEHSQKIKNLEEKHIWYRTYERGYTLGNIEGKKFVIEMLNEMLKQLKNEK